MSRIITRSQTCYKTKSSENGIKYKYTPLKKVVKHSTIKVKSANILTPALKVINRFNNSTNPKEKPVFSSNEEVKSAPLRGNSPKLAVAKTSEVTTPFPTATLNKVMDKNVETSSLISKSTTPERVSLESKSTSTLESSNIPSLADTSKIKSRRNAVYLPEWQALKLPVNSTNTAPVNTKIDENVIKTVGALEEMVVDAILIPDELKIVLLNDSLNINSRKKLYEIPTKLNVLKVIDDYIAIKCLDESLLSGRVIEKVFHDIVDEYFEKFLRSQLLYECEHKQYDAILRKYPGIAMSKAYPPVYLLRLLVQLNKLLPYSQRVSGTLQLILKYINEFVLYLAEHKSALFH